MSLAAINFENVTPEKFAALQKSAETELKGHYQQAVVGDVTSGTLQDHGATLTYSYDSSKNELVLNIVSIGRVFLVKPSLDQVKSNVIKWVEDTIAQSASQTTAATTTTTTGTESVKS